MADDVSAILVGILDNLFKKPEDRELIEHVGAFTVHFSIVELLLTEILNVATGNVPYGKFDLLVRGMDPRVKCQRLREACKAYLPMGPNLTDRVNHFETKLVPLRNRLVHSWPQLQDRRIYFGTVGNTVSDTSVPQHSIGTDEIRIHSLWLNLFVADLLGVLQRLNAKQTCEIIAPKSGLPKDDPQNPLAPIRRDKTGKRILSTP
jgi:hypothetical protein